LLKGRKEAHDHIETDVRWLKRKPGKGLLCAFVPQKRLGSTYNQSQTIMIRMNTDKIRFDYYGTEVP